MISFKEYVLQESIVDFVKRKTGNKFEKIGDVVHGHVVHDYMKKHSFVSKDTEHEIKKTKWKLDHISIDDAKKFRNHSDETSKSKIVGSEEDDDKTREASKRHIDHSSLLKHPPIVGHDGFIHDGNHRIDQAIRRGITHIPVLRPHVN